MSARKGAQAVAQKGSLNKYFSTVTKSSDSSAKRGPAVDTPTDSTASPKRKKAEKVEDDPSSSLSTEQRGKMETNKLEASAKLWAGRLKANQIGFSWMKILNEEFKKPYFEKLLSFVEEERSKGTVYPPANDVFTWTTACSLEEVKVVIIGQDPYHGPNQAHGLCFSVRPGVPSPPSLKNMYKELTTDIEGFELPDHGCLIGWARQGVLLLNACLTVRAHQANSHKARGWESLTDAVIKWLNGNTSDLVFVLWGAYAHKKGSVIDQKRHKVLKGVHPSPLSAHKGFFGCKHFSLANQFLEKSGKAAIDWSCLPKDL